MYEPPTAYLTQPLDLHQPLPIAALAPTVCCLSPTIELSCTGAMSQPSALTSGDVAPLPWPSIMKADVFESRMERRFQSIRIEKNTPDYAQKTGTNLDRPHDTRPVRPPAEGEAIVGNVSLAGGKGWRL